MGSAERETIVGCTAHVLLRCAANPIHTAVGQTGYPVSIGVTACIDDRALSFSPTVVWERKHWAAVSHSLKRDYILIDGLPFIPFKTLPVLNIARIRTLHMREGSINPNFSSCDRVNH